MARIRTIKPEFWRSPSVAAASPWARLLYIAMWNWADDYGTAEWTPRELLGFAFPNDTEAPCTDAEFPRLLAEVESCFGTVFFTHGGRRYYTIPAWDDHQKNERRARGKYPTPDDPESMPDRDIYGDAEMRGTSVHTRGDSSPGKGTGEQGKGNRGTGEQEPASADLVSLFDQVWDRWPKRVERKQALERFKSAARRYPTGAEDLATEIARFGTAYAHTTETRFVPALGVWLNGDRWTDDLPQAPAAQGSAQPKLTAAQRNMQTVALFRDEEERQRLEIEG